MDITVYFIQEILTMIFLLPTMISTVSCRMICETNHVQVQFISWITKWITGLIFYPTSDTEQYQLMILHEFIEN